jgi:hypothetical protein
MSGDVFGNGMLLSERSGWSPPSITATSSSIPIRMPHQALPSASGCSISAARAGRTTTSQKAVQGRRHLPALAQIISL